MDIETIDRMSVSEQIEYAEHHMDQAIASLALLSMVGSRLIAAESVLSRSERARVLLLIRTDWQQSISRLAEEIAQDMEVAND